MFKKEINTSDREAMLCFLEQHPKYHLYNSWNLVKGFSQCIKIHTLDVDDKTKNKFYDMLSLDDDFEIQMIEADEIFTGVEELLNHFNITELA